MGLAAGVAGEAAAAGTANVSTAPAAPSTAAAASTSNPAVATSPATTDMSTAAPGTVAAMGSTAAGTAVETPATQAAGTAAATTGSTSSTVAGSPSMSTSTIAQPVFVATTPSTSSPTVVASSGVVAATTPAATVTAPATTTTTTNTVTTTAPAVVPAVVPVVVPTVTPIAPLTYYDAWRLTDQATFGATEALAATVKAQGAAPWIAAQMAISQSRYTSGGSSAVHTNTSSVGFCDQPANSASGDCWRDNFSTIPLAWDFYRNATAKPDQLRQRVAFALQQIVVLSGLEVEGTYGFRNYYNALLDNAFTNYREVLRKVIQSPVMGDYLNHVNNDKAAPNENFARELLQLFAIGTCELNTDGSLKTGRCAPTYTNEIVRNYAYALTGWTYPSGGSTSWGCWPAGTNCRFYNGDMVPAESLHDRLERKLLSGVTIPAAQGTQVALTAVIDSLMAHPNMAPFIGKQLIQHLVSANPSAAYVQRVSSAFNTGRFTYGSSVFGSGQRGDLAATVAAVLLDADARGSAVDVNSGKLREPVLMFTGVLRQYGGTTDGDALSSWWGETMRQHVFRPPSVFNFYPPDFPVPGTGLMGPSFALHGASAALQRLNFLTFMIDWGGISANASVPGAIGTHIDLTPFLAEAVDAAKLVDRLSLLGIGQPLAADKRTKVIAAVQAYNGTSQALDRVKTAAYLVLASPEYQVQR